MQNLMERIVNVLSQDDRLVVDRKLVKNKVIELSAQLDNELVSSLFADYVVRDQFFIQIKEVWIFDKAKFHRFVSNKSFLPDSFTTYQNKVGLSVENQYLAEVQDVVLAWPYKDCVLEGGQTKEEKARREVMWNSVLAYDQIDVLLSPKALVNFQLHSSKETTQATSISKSDSLIIRGNNLLGLSSIKTVYGGQIKLIYIDPPYNTGNDSFKYNDSFNHSTWLTFMKNRLEVARELLKNDGFILIQIDNNELAYLKVLCDEIFGRSNYRNSIIVKKGTKSLQKQFSEIQKLNAGYDTILLYSKRDTTKLPNLFKHLKGATEASWNNHWRGTDRPTMRYELFGITPSSGQWRWEKNRTENAIENYKKLSSYIVARNGQDTVITDDLIDQYYDRYLDENNITDQSDFELVRLSRNSKPEHYIPPRRSILLSENWMDLSVAGRITDFEHEKNEEIIRRIIEWLTKKNDIVLDFFLGSGSTAAVAHKLGRQYIGIEQMEYGNQDCVKRLDDVVRGDNKGISADVGWTGGGSFISCELAKLNQILIERILNAENGNLDVLYKEICDNKYIKHIVSTNKLLGAYEDYCKLSQDQKRSVLITILDMNQVYVPYSEIGDSEYGISEADKQINQLFYNMGMSYEHE